jgi:hypothetical protein
MSEKFRSVKNAVFKLTLVGGESRLARLPRQVKKGLRPAEMPDYGGE